VYLPQRSVNEPAAMPDSIEPEKNLILLKTEPKSQQ
jgi:hypothetical protein